MKIKLMIAVGLLTLSHSCFPGVIYNNVPVNVTIEGASGTFDKDNFSITFAGSNDKENYPTFRKTVYGWFGQRNNLADQDGKFPQLIRLFIPAGQDSFTFSTDKMDDYINTIDAEAPKAKINALKIAFLTKQEKESNESQEKQQIKDHYKSLVTQLKNDLSDALFNLDLIFGPGATRSVNHYPEFYSKSDPAFKQKEVKNQYYNLYGLNQFGFLELSKITWTGMDKTAQQERVVKAYLAIQEFCKRLGITTPSITAYTDYIAPVGAATALGAYLWYKSKNQ